MKNILKLIILLATLNMQAQITNKSDPFDYGLILPNATEETTATKIPLLDTNLKLNTWITAANLLDGLVSGSGTTNYLAKFTASGIGDSQVFDNGTNVGIKTSSPTRTLDVNGNAHIDDLYISGSEINTYNGGNIDFGAKREADGTSANSTLPNFRFAPTGTGTKGRVSIGAPALGTIDASLHVVVGGNASIVDAAVLEAKGNGGSGRGVGMLFRQPNTLSSTTDAARISASDGGLQIYTGAAGTLTEKVRVTSDGNIGIGTTSPNALLEGVNTDPTRDFLRLSSSEATSGDVFKVDKDGRVGIGAQTAITSDLEIGSATSIKSRSIYLRSNALGSGGQSALFLATHLQGTAVVGFGRELTVSKNTAGKITYNDATDTFVFRTNFNDRFSIDGTGKSYFENEVFSNVTNAQIDAASSTVLVTKDYLSTVAPSGLEAIDEGNGVGWRLIGSDPLNFGDIGFNAIDFGISLNPSNLVGATGSNSFNRGSSGIASGFSSTNFGSFGESAGQFSLNMALYGTAYSFSEVNMGLYPTVYTPSSTSQWIGEDRLFNLGNGTATGTRSNAFTILKNGKTGIGYDNFETTTSDALLQVNGDIEANNISSAINFTPVVTFTSDGVTVPYTTLVTANYSIASDVVTFNIEISDITFRTPSAEAITITGLPAPLNQTTVASCLAGSVQSVPQSSVDCYYTKTGNELKIESTQASTRRELFISGSYIKQ